MSEEVSMWYPLSIVERKDEVNNALRKPRLLRRSNKLGALTLVLIALLRHFSNVLPNYAPNDKEYNVVIKDTEASLHYEFNVKNHVNIDRLNYESYLINILISPTINISILIKCGEADCRFYGDENVHHAQISSSAFHSIVTKTLEVLRNVYEVKEPRILLTPNPTIYGKILFIEGNEEIALSLWELIRVSKILNNRDIEGLSVEDLIKTLDTLVHEFVHYVVDVRYPVKDLFVQLTKRIPTITDDGIIHELIAESVTPIMSRVLAEYMVNGRVITQPSIEELKCHIPPRKRHVLIARQVINDLLSQLLNKINRQ